MASFFKQQGESVIFSDDGELLYYIPEKYFDINVATVLGEYVQTMGIFSYALFNKSGKRVMLKQFKCPTMIKCKPSSTTKVSDFQLEGIKDAQAYRVLHFKKGDELICSTKVPKDLNNVEVFMKLLVRGNLPETIAYNEIHEYILENASMNGFNYKVSGNIIGVLIYELCRDPNDLSKPFRFTDMKDMHDYKGISILKVPKYTSPYTSITSENADEAIASAMTMKSHKDSPLEKVMMT